MTGRFLAVVATPDGFGGCDGGRGGRVALPQAEKREQFARLIAQGFNNSEACRIVGINRRTGKRWRHGRTITTRDGRKLHYAAVVTTAAAGGRSRRGTCLRTSGCGSRTCAGRGWGAGDRGADWAAARRRSAGSCAATGTRAAASTGRSPRTSWPPGGGPGRGRGKIARDEVLRQFVAGPAGEAVEPGADQPGAARRVPGRARRGMWCTRRSTRRSTGPSWAGCPATCRPGCCGPGGGGAGRTAGRASAARTGITAMTMIEQRPAEAAGRSEPGHWEGDLITGASNRSAIGTLVDRASRFTILLHLPGRHTAEAVRDALIAAFCQLPAAAAPVADLGPGQGDGAARSRSPPRWACRCTSATRPARGSGRRTRTPTGCCASTSPRAATCACTAPGDLAAVAAELNARPRKTLGWDTPAARLGRVSQAPSPPRRQPGRRCDDGRHARHAPPQPRTARRAAARSSSSPAWRTSCCASWRRCWPRKASTSTTSTCPTWTPCSRRSTAPSSGTTWPCSPRSGTPATWPPSPCGWPPKPSPTATPRSPPAILDQAQPESPDDSAATVAGCIGARARPARPLAHPGTTPAHPPGLARLTRLPAGHWTGERAATDILALARKGRAFASLDALHRPARRPARPLRQRPRPRRRPPGLGTTRRHPAHRPGPYRHPLKPIRSQPSVASVATMAGIRPVLTSPGRRRGPARGGQRPG